MFYLNIPYTEMFDERTNEFIQISEQTIEMEHSLISISKWESKWKKAFLSKREKTYEETFDYLRCMAITKNVNPEIYKCITHKQINEINEYISDPMTASYFMETYSKSKNTEVITSELIYYWMISFNIPFECQKWHINKLLALIKVCELKSPYRKKKTKREILEQNVMLNEMRRKQLNSNG